MATQTALALLALTLASPACAQGLRTVGPYAPAPYAASDGEGGFAGEFIRGTYIGAPLTRVPSPAQIVPAPWSYGTYGVPTVSGIAAPPAAQPTITVIHATGPARSRRVGTVEAPRTPGPQIIAVQVPRR
jgi:hypothetical protein